jgi:AcrR family transcriptional regulator
MEGGWIMSPRPVSSKDTQRAEEQRERILCAAQQCFIRYGFHAASMASIAETARMSPGLVYRYFENKSAIVLAIVERQLRERRAHVARLHSSADLSASILATFEKWRTGDPTVVNPALLLEMSAEATRDPQIAEALRSSDEQVFADLRSWMVRGVEDGGMGLPPDVAERRVILLEFVVYGLAVIAARQPGRAPEALRETIEAFVNRLLAP